MKSEMDMNRREFMKQTAAGAAVSTVGLPSMLRAQASDRPNIVLFLADDMTWRDCGVYGSDVVQTPNMDRLAGEGKRFDGCFTSTSVCAPTRQQLYTGMFPVRNGAYPQAGFVHDGVRSLPHHFKDLGYRVGLVGKTHFGPAESFPFELLRPTKTRELLDSEKSLSVIKGFINQESEQPYCLVITSHNPHLPYTHGPQDLYDPDKLKIPPYLIDTPETRKRLANYYAEITALDAELGRCMKIVDESAGADNTLMAFTTEQGSAFPYGGKWTCYENGLHTGLIMRWPGKIAAGSSSDALVQYVDIVPTLLEAASGDPTKVDTGRPGASDGGSGFDGRSFLNVVTGDGNHHRDYVYGVYTNRGVRGGTDYPIRSVRSDRYKYIANLNHEGVFECNVTRFMKEMGWPEAAEKNPELAPRVNALMHRPAVEFYDLKSDPYELNNLAGDSNYADTMKVMRAELEAWMAQQNDAGMKTELEAPDRMNPASEKYQLYQKYKMSLKKD